MRKVVFSRVKIAFAVLLVGLFLPFSSLFAERVCTVSSDPDKNGGFCREISGGGGDACYVSGSGTACSGNAVIIQPVFGL